MIPCLGCVLNLLLTGVEAAAFAQRERLWIAGTPRLSPQCEVRHSVHGGYNLKSEMGRLSTGCRSTEHVFFFAQAKVQWEE